MSAENELPNEEEILGRRGPQPKVIKFSGETAGDAQKELARQRGEDRRNPVDNDKAPRKGKR